MPFEPTDQQHLTRAQGYVELGMFLDANEELENMDAEVRHLPEVLAVRVDIYSALKQWELMQVVAKRLAKYDPNNSQWWISWAYATRRVENVESAKIILLEAVKQHSKEPIIHYNLACYECQLGDIDRTKEYLEIAFELAPQRIEE